MGKGYKRFALLLYGKEEEIAQHMGMGVGDRKTSVRDSPRGARAASQVLKVSNFSLAYD
jgi:hypothetical protein